MRKALILGLLGGIPLGAQVNPPPPTGLPNAPYEIRKRWIIGGMGNWDYLTVDPVAGQLFIAHGPQVQVVDIETGSITGAVTGLHEAHSVVLDDTGEYGYVSDGPADKVKVFDRRTLAVKASIASGPRPRALAYDPVTKLLFAIGAEPRGEDSATPAQPGPQNGPRGTGAARPPAPGSVPAARAPAGRTAENPKSTITVIDTGKREALAEIILAGRLGFAQPDGNGLVFVNVVDRNQVARFDVQAISALLERLLEPGPTRAGGAPGGAERPLILDWSGGPRQTTSGEARPRYFSLGGDCREPHGLAIDAKHLRLFAACNNLKMVVLNADTGESIASLPIGPGPEGIGYDTNRGIIYTANGGAQGSVTVVRQTVTDTYSVIQTLPTWQRARTLAVNPDTGEVYLVTDLAEVLQDKPGGNGTLRTAPVPGSFHVLVVGN